MTLLEALAHTRRLRVQLSTLHSLCLEPTSALGAGAAYHGRLLAGAGQGLPIWDGVSGFGRIW